MLGKSFYVDSCIYLNLWQKEKRFWRQAKDFFERHNDSTFYYSGPLLKELKYIISKELFAKQKKKFEQASNFRKVSLFSAEFALARKIESDLRYGISFADIIHLLLAKQTNSILVTRDRGLLRISKRYDVVAKRPEELW